jgi:hypothetical protein
MSARAGRRTAATTDIHQLADGSFRHVSLKHVIAAHAVRRVLRHAGSAGSAALFESPSDNRDGICRACAVREVLEPPGFGQMALRLVEIRNPPWSLTRREISFAARYFRPLDEEWLDQFMVHLEPRLVDALELCPALVDLHVARICGVAPPSPPFPLRDVALRSGGSGGARPPARCREYGALGPLPPGG